MSLFENREVWKDIPGYEGRYQASNLGRIKSLKRYVRGKCRFTGKDFYRSVPEKILKPGASCRSGHLSVVLGRGSSGHPVHQLILKAFMGIPPQNCEVLHIDGDPRNNKLPNLRYGTRTDNILDVYRQGKNWRKLSVDDVCEIRKLLAEGKKGSSIARLYGVSESTVSSIKLKKTYWWLK